MTDRLLKQFIKEALLNELRRDEQFIQHLKNGLDYGKGNMSSEAYQIVSDWVEDTELRMGNLMHPGYVTRIEKFVANQWPVILEQYRGNKRMALIAMNNMLNAKFNELRNGN